MSGRRRPDGEVPGSRAQQNRLERERDYDRMDRQRAEEREGMERETERRNHEREKNERDGELNEQQRREQLERTDAQSTQRGDVPDPKDIADAHQSPPGGGVSPDEARRLGDLLGPPPTQKPPETPPPAPPAPPAPPSTPYRWDPPMRSMWWSPMGGCLPLLGGGLTLLGLALIAWSFTGGRSDYGVVPGTPVATAPAATATASPATAQIRGFTISYRGPLTARTGETLNVPLQVLDAQGRPAQGTVFATLGDPPSDARASHGNAVLDGMGRATIPLRVNWPSGTTRLYTSWQDMVAPLTTMTIQPGTAAAGVNTATANLSFTRVSGPATLARTFSDRFAFRWNDRMVDLTQMSNDHKASGARTGNNFTARGTDGQEYRGTISESGGSAVFQGQLTGPNNSYVYSFNGETVGPITRSAPAAAATPTAAATATAAASPPAGTAAGTTGGEPNYPLAGTGLLLSIGGLGLGLFGRRYVGGVGGGKNAGGLVFPIPYPGGGAVGTQDKEKEETDRCAPQRARAAEARARLDAAKQRFEQLDAIRQRHHRAQVALANAEHPYEAGALSAGRSTASREIREEVTGAQNAWDAAGDGAAHSAAQEELRAAEKEWEAADAALRGCMGGPGGRGR